MLIPIESEIIDSLYKQALYFLDNQDDQLCQARFNVHLNPLLHRRCKAIHLFCKAVISRGKRRGWKSLIDNSIFAWHGTCAESNIVSICDQGFDPRRRRSCMHGRGEYFATDPSTSMLFAKHKRSLILAALLRVSESRLVNSCIYVVRNPPDASMSYCLPLLVVTFDKSAQEPPWKLSKAYPSSGLRVTAAIARRVANKSEPATTESTALEQGQARSDLPAVRIRHAKGRSKPAAPAAASHSDDPDGPSFKAPPACCCIS